jgi:cell surface protein SprA
LTYKKKYTFFILGILSLFCLSDAKANVVYRDIYSYHLICRADSDTLQNNALPYPFTDESGEMNPLYAPNGGMMLSNPSNIKTDVEYNTQNGQYDIYQKMGTMDYRPPTEMDSDQYEEYMWRQAEKNYFQQKVNAESTAEQQRKALIPPIKIGGKFFEDVFGGNTVNITPQGSAELTFGFNNSKMLNPALPVAQQSLTTFNFDENIQLNVTGQIGTKLKLSTSYNTKATFDFQNVMKLQYQGKEDDIIKEIDAGNVTFDLPGTLITGSQSLFGVKLKTQFGRLTSTTVYAQEKGDKKTLTVQNGSQTTNFNIKADQYMANQHYFLAQYFRDNYDSALENLPLVTEGVTITRVEVWVTNTTSATLNTRYILAFSDLGESKPHFTEHAGGPVTLNSQYGYTSPSAKYLPSDSVNSLDPYILERGAPGVSVPTSAISSLLAKNLQQVTDYEKVDLARMLGPSEYTLNARLGYISLKQPLNYSQVLAVAFQYTKNGQVYQVGQFSTDGVPTTNEMVVKMLKSTNVAPSQPIWNLMMKNIYSLGSYQINSQNFMLNVWYDNAATGYSVPYLPQGNLEGKQLIGVLGLDQLDQEGDRVPDGLFDFVPGITIDPTNGYIIFPSVEPFGYYLKDKMIAAGDGALTSNYVYQPLYDSLLISAQQIPTLDRYFIKGSFQSSASSDINLGASNIPPGSVTVTAGGQKLTENVDYTVDYTLGRLKIINQGLLSSGTPIQVSLENNALFSIQSKTFFGQHFDYMVAKDFNVGATVVNFTEHPLTQIVSIGQEPVSNTMLGLNGDFKKPAPFLTDLIDDLPFIHTKAPSEITASSEVAAMIPGHPKFIGSTGTAYIDDFEGTESFIDISPPTTWSLASIPGGQSSEFPEAAYNNDLRTGMNRAKVAWYSVDPLFQQNEGGVSPVSETANQMSDDRIRMVLQTEIFPDEQSATGTPINLPVLNVGFYPQMRGPYNYDPPNGTNVSKGVADNAGDLNDPISRWGGIMRPISETDFITDNIQYIEFWMMSPYTPYDTVQNTTGTLYFDLGSVSEDVLKDGQKSFENGLPTDAADAANAANTNNPWDSTAWGHMPVNPSLVNAFDNDETTRPFQDIGLDGLSDAQEQTFFHNYVSLMRKKYPGQIAAGTNAYNDPSTDDFHYYRGDDYDAANLGVVQRYLKYNGLEGNSPTQLQYGNENPNGGNYPTDETTLPNTEDINQDNTLEQVEAYYEYAVDVTPNAITPTSVGSNYIVSAEQVAVQVPNGTTHQTWWYQFKIPINNYARRVGQISDFNSIQYIRMYFKGFNNPVLLRFGKLELVSDAWRKYTSSLLGPGDFVPNEAYTTFDEYGVNLEENSNTTPVNYVIPPGIQRQLNLQSANLVQENEGSLALVVTDLQSGDARGVTKNTQLDLRAYKTLNMFLHCESDPTGGCATLNNGDVTAFIRLGSDYTDNYYEYEVPLAVTPPGNYNTNNNNDQLAVWPLSNTMDISLSTLENAKLARDAAMQTNSFITLATPYTVKDGANNVTVVGNPTISSVQVMMLGVRNPKQTAENKATNNGKAKCAEVWFDELRMTDFNEKGGVATIDRATAKLADLGTLSLSGNASTPGFGTLESSVGNLSRETDIGYAIATNLEMGKFLPPSWNVSIPTYMSYSDQWILPEYNPLDPDILLTNTLNTYNKEGQDSIKSMVISRTIAKSLNFTNVHKNKSKNSKKSHFYDITNFSGSYAFTEQSSHDVNYILNFQKSYKGGLTYNYSFHPKAIEPLKKVDFLRKRKYLALVSDFNFYPMIDKLSINSTLDREYGDFQIRNIIPGSGDLQLPIAVNKVFNVARTYSFTYPITKSLQLDYMATNDSRVDEPEGSPITSAQGRDTVRSNFFTHQVNTDFKQTAGLNYVVPLKEIPGLDFVTLTAHYASSYEWLHAPFGYDSLGATISNSNTESLNGSFNMSTLYNKIPYLKDMLANEDKKQQVAPPTQSRGLNGRQGQQKLPAQTEDTADEHDGIYYGEEYMTYLLTSLKTFNLTYSDTRGTVLPGFTGTSTILGMDPSENWQPGPAFVFGSQAGNQIGNPNQTDNATGIIRRVEQDSLLTHLVNDYSPVTMANTQTYSMHASLMPLPDLKLDLTANRTSSETTSFYLRDTLGTDGQYHYSSNTYNESGNFSMSYLFVKTIFSTGGYGNTGASQPFLNFLNDGAIISTRLGIANHNPGGGPNPLTPGYYNGYSLYSQDVAIPAFLAAYSGQSPYKVTTNPFPNIPLPNWTLSYNIYKPVASIWPWAKKNITSITLSNAYSGTYSIGGYSYNPLFVPGIDGLPSTVDLNGDFIDKTQIPAVSLADQFSPLAKLVVAFKNGVSSNFEIRDTRQVALDMSDIEITEVNGMEYLLGLGYKIKGVRLPFTIGGKAIKNDITLKADFSLMDNESIVRNAIDESNQITGGQQIISIKTQAEYNINTRITFRIFFDKVINNPFISSTFPTSTMDGGIAIRFSLS